jgi:cyclopropane fatty-acyl-phospholipid synthase-like methyltransferase
MAEAKESTEFERWETRFAAPGYIFGKGPNAFLGAQGHRLKGGGKALTIADGEGRNGVWLAEQGLDVLSVDFSPNAQKKALALAKERGVPLRVEHGDVLNWNWPDAAFDVIAAIFVQFAAPPERDRMFAGLKKALKKGGLLLMQGYRPEQLKYKTGGPPHEDHLYTRALLEAAFADFASVEIHEHDSVVSEGTAHNGMSALIDFVGRK